MTFSDLGSRPSAAAPASAAPVHEEAAKDYEGLISPPEASLSAEVQPSPANPRLVIVLEMSPAVSRWRLAGVGMGLVAALALTGCGGLSSLSNPTLVPSSDRSATIALESLAPAVGRRSLVLTRGPQLTSLIRLLNRLETVPPPGPGSCDLSTTSVKLTFRRREGMPENAVANQEIGCSDFKLQVGSGQLLLKLAPLASRELSLLQLTMADLHGPGS